MLLNRIVPLCASSRNDPSDGTCTTECRHASATHILAEVGVGYKSREQWHVAVKFRHISNGGTGGHKCGVNGVGLGVGYTF